jgi:hypothetical protein
MRRSIRGVQSAYAHEGEMIRDRDKIDARAKMIR